MRGHMESVHAHMRGETVKPPPAAESPPTEQKPTETKQDGDKKEDEAAGDEEAAPAEEEEAAPAEQGPSLDDTVKELVEAMGGNFSEEQCRGALEACGGSIELAVCMLLE